MDGDTWIRLGVVLGMGLLIGLQRERASTELGGVRTFPIIALTGAVSALLAGSFGGWIVAASLLGFSLFVYVSQQRSGASESGMTSEISALLVFLLGAWMTSGPLAPAIVVSGVLLVLLEMKPELHGWVERLQEQDVRSLVQFVLISCVVLPILPDRFFGPFDALNLREIWLMVVLVVGVSLVGYAAQKLVRNRSGSLITGILGGLVSSTATTASFARAGRTQLSGEAVSALVIMLATTVVYLRIGIVATIAAPDFAEVWWPLSALFGFALLSSGVAYAISRRDGEPSESAPVSNPGELKAALVFAALFAAVNLGIAAGRHYFGDTGLYAAAAISGLTDLDAITLSTARLVAAGKLDAHDGSGLVITAGMANLVFKTALVAVLGSRRLLVRVAILFGANFIAAAVALFVLLY